MRLLSVTRDIPWSRRLLYGTLGCFGVKLLMGRVMGHRPELWSGPFSTLSQATLRHDSPWSIFERELFAGFSANIEQCPY